MSFTLQVYEDDPTEVFEVLDKLGEGSYGSVFKCRRRKDGQLLAVKVVPIETDAKSIKNEIDVLNECQSDYIVSYQGTYEKNGDLWIAMEYMDAGSLSDIIDVCGTLHEDLISGICYCILEGLIYLHSNRKLHRDIKAANVLIDAQGKVKLADFGVSAGLKFTFSKRNTQIGSPFWMAPEVIQEEDYDGRADIWSLGITCLEMAEGEPPHYDLAPMKALFLIPSIAAPKLKSDSSWSPEFKNFLEQCLCKNAMKRPNSSQLAEHPFVKRGAEKVGEIKDLVQTYTAKLAANRANPSRQGSFEEDPSKHKPPAIEIKKTSASEQQQQHNNNNNQPSSTSSSTPTKSFQSTRPKIPVATSGRSSSFQKRPSLPASSNNNNSVLTDSRTPSLSSSASSSGAASRMAKPFKSVEAPAVLPSRSHSSTSTTSSSNLGVKPPAKSPTTHSPVKQSVREADSVQTSNTHHHHHHQIPTTTVTNEQEPVVTKVEEKASVTDDIWGALDALEVDLKEKLTHQGRKTPSPTPHLQEFLTTQTQTQSQTQTQPTTQPIYNPVPVTTATHNNTTTTSNPSPISNSVPVPAPTPTPVVENNSPNNLGAVLKGVLVYEKSTEQDNIVGEVIMCENSTIEDLAKMIITELGCQPGFSLKKNNIPIPPGQYKRKACELFRFETDHIVILYK